MRLLKAASAALKRVDPGAVVVSAGISQSRLGIPFARRGDDAPIWVLELGWASGGPVGPFTAGKLGQAVRVRRSLILLARRRPDLGVRGVVYYAWRDSRPYPPNFRDFWGLHTGLLDLAGRPKPALEAFRATLHRLLARYGQAGAGR